MSQLEREKQLSEIVLRYRENEEANMSQHHVAQMAINMMRSEILEWIKIKNKVEEATSTNETDPFHYPLETFQRTLGRLTKAIPDKETSSDGKVSTRKIGRPSGSKHSFKDLWRKHGLSLEEHKFKEDAALLFYITLYILIENTIKNITDIETTKGAVTKPSDLISLNEMIFCNDNDKEAAEIDNMEDAIEKNIDDENSYDSQDTWLSQPSLYEKIWETIALELYFRDNDGFAGKPSKKIQYSGRTFSAKIIHSTKKITEYFAEEKEIDLKKRMEFAASLFDAMNNSFEEQWFDIVTVWRELKHFKTKINVILPSQNLIEKINKLTRTKLHLDYNAPLIEPPLDWGPGGIETGGYHYRELPFYKFTWKNKKINEFLAKFKSDNCFPEVFAATNVLQQTGWRINRSVWNVVAELYKLAGVDFLNNEDSTLFPELNTQNHEKLSSLINNDKPLELSKKQIFLWKKWLRSDDNFYNRSSGLAKGPGARNASRLAISTLLDALPRQRIYFAYQADTRGRLYPVGSILHPLGDDLNRALLEFADPLPLTDDGIRPLAIYGSQQIKDATILRFFNIQDRDKPTLDERFEYIEKNTDKIIRCAEAPLEETWWRGGVDLDSPLVSKPFTFLAFCFAWRDYRKNGTNVNCHLPVHVDGTCNGLQHIAALMSDVDLAEATNVLPSDEPRDIYSEIAHAVQERILQPICEPGTSVREKTKAVNDYWHNEGVSKFLQNFKELVDRDLAKSVVMIIPYGAGRTNYKKKIYEKLKTKILPKNPSKQASNNQYAEWIMMLPDLEKWQPEQKSSKQTTTYSTKTDKIPIQPNKTNPDKLIKQTIDRWTRDVCASQLADFFDQVVNERYPNIKVFKKRLIKCTQPLYELGIPAMWVSPSGFPVLQNGFRQKKLPEIKVHAVSSIRFRIYQIADEINKVSQVSGILPNFIHSMDAAHLVKTINLAKERQITNLSTVHDSYATHACNIGRLGECIRDAFCDLYPPDEDRLVNFERWCNDLCNREKNSENSSIKPIEQALLELARSWFHQETQSSAKPNHHSAKNQRMQNTALVQELVSKSNDHRTATTEEYWINNVKKSLYFFS